MPLVTIESLAPDREDEAARMLARAFVTNPLHVGVFGPDRIAANETFFRMALPAMKGAKLVAVDGQRITGFIRWIDSSKCQASSTQKLKTFPAMVKGLGLRSTLKVVRWLSIWSKHDPKDAHIHLGPIGVAPEFQGQGIGRQLMERYCAELDRTRSVGYLETDRLGNVDFYKKFGFEVTGTALVASVPNYFMRRSVVHTN